jgi:hypothetical protein
MMLGSNGLMATARLVSLRIISCGLTLDTHSEITIYAAVKPRTIAIDMVYI